MSAKTGTGTDALPPSTLAHQLVGGHVEGTQWGGNKEGRGMFFVEVPVELYCCPTVTTGILTNEACLTLS